MATSAIKVYPTGCVRVWCTALVNAGTAIQGFVDKGPASVWPMHRNLIFASHIGTGLVQSASSHSQHY